MTGSRVQASPWADSRRRAETLLAQHDHAAEMLALYLALLDVWEQSWEAARSEEPEDLARWAADRVAPQVIAVTERSGPVGLRNALKDAFAALSDAKASFRAFPAGGRTGSAGPAMVRPPAGGRRRRW